MYSLYGHPVNIGQSTTSSCSIAMDDGQFISISILMQCQQVSCYVLMFAECSHRPLFVLSALDVVLHKAHMFTDIFGTRPSLRLPQDDDDTQYIVVRESDILAQLS